MEVRKQHHDGPVSLKTDGGAEGLSDVGALGDGLEEEDFANQAESMASTSAGRDEEFVAVGEEEEADFVVVLHGTEGEDCGDFGCEFPLGAGGAENAGGADVDE